MIRPAVPADVPDVLRLVKELAAYEQAADSVQMTVELLHTALFSPGAVVECHVAVADERVVGFALWYRTFSTWTGTPGMWLEDLFVEPSARGTGLGRALLEALAAVCTDRGWSRFEWWVLDWNTSAQGFYRSLGARPEDEWTVWRVDGAALSALAQRGHVVQEE